MIELSDNEYLALKHAMHVAMLALHYANKDSDGIDKRDPTLLGAIADLGRQYHMLKKKGAEP